MNAVTNSPARRGTSRDKVDAGAARTRPRAARLGRRPKASRRFWAWLCVAVAIVSIAAYGCGGGKKQAEAPGEPAAGGPAGPPGPPAQPPKEKPKEAPKEEEKAAALPEEISEWKTEDFYLARKGWDPRLVEAVAHLGKQFAGTENAESAGQLLTNLLKKSETPPPSASRQRGGSAGMMGPGMGGYEGMAPSMEPSSMGPGMYGPAGPEGMEETDSGMEETDDAMAGEEEDGRAGYEEAYQGAMGPGGPTGSGTGRGSARAGAMRGGQQAGGGKPALDPITLIEAIIPALGVNDSKTARKTLTEVVEGKFETDDNRAATLATLDTMVARLSSEYEALLLRCLTSPEEMRELGKTGQQGGRRQGPGSAAMGSAGYPGGAMGYPGGPGQMGMGRGGTGAGPLTAEELQRAAFNLIAPTATEELRVKLAQHLVDPNTPQEDVDLFGPYLREANATNLPAQLVLYFAKVTSQETKETVADNFITFSSDALGTILGVPLEDRKPRQPRRQVGRGGPGYGGMPGSMGSEMMERGMMPGEEEDGPEGGMDSRDYAEAMMNPNMTGPAAAGRRGSQPGAGDRGGRAGQQGGSQRRSRYDTVEGAPGAGPAEAGPAPPAADPDQPYRVARKMWSGELTGPLASRLNEVQSLETDAPVILLAGTMPVDSVRSTLSRILRARFEDGPAGLEAAGLLDEVVIDPGLLTVVKGLPRKARKAEQPVRPRPGTGRRGSGRPGEEGDREGGAIGPGSGPPGSYEGAGGMGPGGQRGAPGRPAPEDAGEAWMYTSEDMVRVLCERLLAAARAGAGGAAPAAAEGQPGHGLPFALRDDATVMAEYHLDWPAGADEKLSGVPLGEMKLHYVRTEQTTRLTTLESYFKRQVGGNPDVHEVHDGSWMDSFKPVPDTDWKRSVDILMTTTVPPTERVDKKIEVPVTVDILCIDVKAAAVAGG